MIGEDTDAWRNDLQHLAKSGKTYFITFVTHERHVLAPQERDIALSTILHSHRKTMYLHAGVVMPDHVHLLLTPYEDITLAKLMQQLKSVSAHRIAKQREVKSPVWQREYFDRVMRSDEDLREKAEYIVNNPVRAGLVARVDDYPWIYRWWIDDIRGGEGAAAPLSSPFELRRC